MSSLYVHVPFCQHICSYCDFAKVYYNESWVNQYLEVLRIEIKEKKITEDFDTIYIGGGTPSSLSFYQLEELLKILKPFTHHIKEYSIEVNPESMNEDKLKLMKDYGINRISIGVQTFNDELLKYIDRYHDSQMVCHLISLAKQIGIDDINIDLIYGLPHQTLNDVKEDIDKIANLDISHVSIYSLILEDNTKLKNQNYQPLDDEEDSLWYDFINHELKKKGFHHYEVSNYYKKKPSLHNLVYWQYKDYEGIGLGAHSLKNHKRYENTRSLTKYLKGDYLSEVVELNKDDELFEMIMMGLRLLKGIDILEVNHKFHISFEHKYHHVIEKYQKLQMLELENHYLRPNEKGMKFLNSILIDFME